MSTRVEPLIFVIGVWPSIWYELHIAEPDSSNRVRGLDDLSNALAGEAVFSVRLPRQSHSLRRPWTGHLECEGSVVRYCIKASESFASE